MLATRNLANYYCPELYLFVGEHSCDHIGLRYAYLSCHSSCRSCIVTRDHPGCQLSRLQVREHGFGVKTKWVCNGKQEEDPERTCTRFLARIVLPNGEQHNTFTLRLPGLQAICEFYWDINAMLCNPRLISNDRRTADVVELRVEPPTRRFLYRASRLGNGIVTFAIRPNSRGEGMGARCLKLGR